MPSCTKPLANDPPQARLVWIVPPFATCGELDPASGPPESCSRSGPAGHEVIRDGSGICARMHPSVSTRDPVEGYNSVALYPRPLDDRTCSAQHNRALPSRFLDAIAIGSHARPVSENPKLRAFYEADSLHTESTTPWAEPVMGSPVEGAPTFTGDWPGKRADRS